VRAGIVFALVIGWLAGDAASAPSRRERIVLADRDPELRHAMEQALAPWHLDVVIEGSPADAATAQHRADADTARFVVWRDGDELVVYDRELGSIERRTSRSGPLDPPAAAAAALTVKTMMRLPPPPDALADAPAPELPIEPARPGEARELRVQAGISTRIARGDTTDVTARMGAAAALQAWPGSRWRLGLAIDGGSSTAVERASFKGTWSEWAVLAQLSATAALGAWEIEPHAGFGVRRSTLDGSEMNSQRSEAATLATARGGVWLRRRVAQWTFGAALSVDRTFGTPTYTKAGTPAEIFQVPQNALELGGVIAVDL
jgi:hypothetical protein